MMASSAHVKLGALVLVTLVSIVAIGIMLGFREAPHDTYHTYFDETVQGLEVGAVVKYRGVQLGKVRAIEIAKDQRHVHVVLALDRKRVRRLALAARTDVHAELAILGVTGLKIIDLDVSPPGTSLPVLGFTPERPYVPSNASLFGQLQETVASTSERLPVVLDQVISLTRSLDGLLAQAHKHQLADRIATALGGATELSTQAQRIARRVDRDTLPRLTSALAGLDRISRKLEGVIGKIDGDDGVLSSVTRATDALGELGRETRDDTAGLDQTLREVTDAARSLRELAEDLRRQPDMLIKGRARPRKP